MFDNSKEFYEEVQVNLNVDLQKLCSHYLAAGLDPFAFFSLTEAISKQYLKNLKDQYRKMAKNRESFEQDFRKDVESIADEV
jgi:hypothetical protein